MREKGFLAWTKIALISLLTLTTLSVVSCGSDDEDQTNTNFNPFPGGPVNPGIGFPPGVGGAPGLYNGPIFQDQFSPQIIQALQAVQCPLGRYAMSFIAPPNGQGNRIFGPFQQGGSPFGQVIAAYIGGNQANGDIMIIRKLGNGFNVSGYHMELHLCIDNILVTPQRQLTNFQLRNNQPIVLDFDARCAVGDIDFAPAQMTAMPGGFYSQPAPVFIGIAPLGLNFCGF